MINQRKVSEPVLLRHGDVVAIGIELLEFVDLDMLHRPESLSTIPPPVMATRVGDEDAPDAVTLASGTERSRTASARSLNSSLSATRNVRSPAGCA